MKTVVVILVVLLGLAGGGYWLAEYAFTPNAGRLIGYAIGNNELHVCITGEMTNLDPPRLSNMIPQWPEWVHDHFELRDSAGQRIELSRAGTSAVISAADAKLPAFFITASLKAGTQYTLDYLPVRTEKQRYRLTVTAAPDGHQFERTYFPPVGETAGR